MAEITKVADRAKLKARAEPYWRAVERGNFLGFRKATNGNEGSWIARSRDLATGKQRYQSLGSFDELPPSDRYTAASAAAVEWFKHLGAGGSHEVVTVRSACEAYLLDLENNGRNETATDAKGRFTRWIYSQPKLADTELRKLKPLQLSHWRAQLLKAPAVRNPHAAIEDRVSKVRSKGSVNRDMSALRAALNLALRRGAVVSDLAWREELRPFENADGRRNVYLTRESRRKLIAACTPDLAAFVTLLCSLPLRPGTASRLQVGDFEPDLGVLTIGRDKKSPGGRKIQLPEATAEMFRGLSQGRQAKEPLVAQSNGKAWSRETWKKPFKQVAAAAGLPEETVAYSLRHSTITDLVSAGLDLASVAAISGTSVVMIEKHYKHLQQERVVQALGGLLL